LLCKKPGFPLQSFLPQRGKKVFPLQSLARSVKRAFFAYKIAVKQAVYNSMRLSCGAGGGQ
jgi:hypothetical protein